MSMASESDAAESDAAEVKLVVGEGEEPNDTSMVKMRLTRGRSRKAR